MSAAGVGRPSAIDIAEIAAAAAVGADEMVEVTAGPGGYGATYGPGRRIPGVRVRRTGDRLEVEVSVSLLYPSAVFAVGERVRDRVSAALRALPTLTDPPVVTVRIVDVVSSDDGPGEMSL